MPVYPVVSRNWLRCAVRCDNKSLRVVADWWNRPRGGHRSQPLRPCGDWLVASPGSAGYSPGSLEPPPRSRNSRRRLSPTPGSPTPGSRRGPHIPRPRPPTRRRRRASIILRRHRPRHHRARVDPRPQHLLIVPEPVPVPSVHRPHDLPGLQRQRPEPLRGPGMRRPSVACRPSRPRRTDPAAARTPPAPLPTSRISPAPPCESPPPPACSARRFGAPRYVLPLGLYRNLFTRSGCSRPASLPISARCAIGPASISRRSRRFSTAPVCTSISPARCMAAICSICAFTSLSRSTDTACPASVSGCASLKFTARATISNILRTAPFILPPACALGGWPGILGAVMNLLDDCRRIGERIGPRADR